MPQTIPCPSPNESAERASSLSRGTAESRTQQTLLPESRSMLQSMQRSFPGEVQCSLARHSSYLSLADQLARQLRLQRAHKSEAVPSSCRTYAPICTYRRYLCVGTGT